MHKYSSSVITRDRKGNEEVKFLVDKGRFIRYQYIDPETGNIVEEGRLKTCQEGLV